MSHTYDSDKIATEGGNFCHPGAPRNVSIQKDVAAGRLRDQLKTFEERGFVLSKFGEFS